MAERHEIECFLAVARELHFGRAADRLLVTRARVSQTIQKLERRIGAPLFERSSRHVRLTPLGQQLRTDIEGHHQAILDGFARAAATARGITGVLRIGVLGSYGHLMLDVFETFRSRHPDCEIDIREVQLNDPFGALRADELDLVVPWLPVREPDLTVGPTIGTEPIALAVAPHHRFAGRESVSLEELADERTVTVATKAPDYWLEAHRPSHTPSGRPIQGPAVTTFEQILATVATGQAVSFVSAHAPVYFSRPSVVYVPISDAPLVSWGLVWRSSGVNDRIRAFCQVAREVLTDRDRR
ncbi:LysR family transcriptional regulator [Kitasatospora sp. NPDC059648]|uniref:LysR family transcriptional regulator n=1 Tax=Kitasatospora sp. NPDC059648 TaxID=3346894 RepID=UPI00367D09CA